MNITEDKTDPASHDMRVARNRRAIYTGLKPFLPEDELIAALALWQNRFSSGQAYALHGFLGEICTTAQLRQIRSDIHRSLTHALFGPEEALESDPLSLIQRWNSARENGKAAARKIAAEQRKVPSTPMTLVFESFFEHFMALLEEEQQVSHQIREYIHMHLEKILSTGTGPKAAQVSKWLRGRQAYLENGLTLDEMRAILHIAYVLACQYIGPVTTDRLLSEAVRHSESLDLSRQFSPRSFL
jgi:hypothetical protein